MAKRRGKREGGTIIIRREDVVTAPHHGGSWKVAYADFVTAMMAFFLLMWLLNATTEQQRRGIAAYFSPMASVENGFSGAGLVPGGISPLDGGTSLTAKGTGTPPVPNILPSPVPLSITPSSASDANAAGGAQDDDNDDMDARKGGQAQTGGAADARPDPASKPAPTAGSGADMTEAAKAAAEQKTLVAAASGLRQLVASDPALGASAGQMAIDVTPEGLRIQIMDRDGQPMFNRGTAMLNDRAAALLRKVAPFLAGLSEPVSIGGYTDAAAWPSGALSNWSLSSGRADAARDVLAASGLPDSRITDVTGFADRHLLLPADPMASANRRVVLTLRRRYDLPDARSPNRAGG